MGVFGTVYFEMLRRTLNTVCQLLIRMIADPTLLVPNTISKQAIFNDCYV
jgi:hypothetical protein